jgi:hypothetical protein
MFSVLLDSDIKIFSPLNNFISKSLEILPMPETGIAQ